MHAQGLKMRLEQLAEVCNQNPELESEIQNFFSETFSGLVKIMALCKENMAEDDTTQDDARIGIEFTQSRIRLPASRRPVMV